MELKTLGQKVKGLTDGGEDRGVSPVIGVILMVAITVILAAVIGAFVLNLGNDLDASSTPTASVNAEVIIDDNGTTDTSDDYENVVFTHQNGDTIEAEDLKIVYDGNRVDVNAAAGTFGTGSTINAEDDTSSAASPVTLSSHSGSVSLVYDDGESSNSLATIEVDNA